MPKCHSLLYRVKMKIKKREVIDSEGRAMIARVFHFLRDEYDFMKTHNVENSDLSPLANIRRRTAEATGVSERTVSRILKEEKELPLTSYRFVSPMSKRRRRAAKVDVDELTVSLMHSIIQNYQIEHNESPTLTKLQSIFREKFQFTGCLNTLRNLLMKLGYKWSRSANNKWTLKNTKEPKHKAPSKNIDIPT
ncbi:uncharacterized protein [Epargyreus clarus]|uniref:uncharacterized protein n=1 Tax=Epargyreus clarus TaxID=520877 RepID=UPI003C30AD60